MIDLQTEQLVSLQEATRHLPRRPHYSTLFRWATSGTRYGRLETCIIGGQRYTSIEALQRFADRSTAVANGEHSVVQRSNRREREIAAAEARLAEQGI